MRIVICAYDYREAEQVRRRMQLAQAWVVYASDEWKLQGLGTQAIGVVTTPRFSARRGSLAVLEELARLEALGTKLHRLTCPEGI
ncbi:hypothetical protein ACFWYW_46780 [Nonomuraea sp. NPDC059023]|uniref:hypothetical protein n=1 Tax=unclassified Nonomuraea TaxID=2593643 RepID=UPI0036991F72